jgi:hypothetical protein
MNSQFAKLKGSPKTGRGLRQEEVEYKETRNTEQIALGSGREYDEQRSPRNGRGVRQTEKPSDRAGSTTLRLTKTALHYYSPS